MCVLLSEGPVVWHMWGIGSNPRLIILGVVAASSGWKQYISVILEVGSAIKWRRDIKFNFNFNLYYSNNWMRYFEYEILFDFFVILPKCQLP